MTGQAYFIGRAQGTMQPPYCGADEVYGGERLDGKTLDKPTYEHCTFANISFKNAKLYGGHFLNCVFVACFFRRTDVQSCNFSSCRFIDCEFPGASFSGCDFRYTRFAGCYIPFDEIEHSLPQEPNLREDLSRNLAREAATLGDPRTARTFRLCEVQARETNYRAAVMAKTKWYKDHYNGVARVVVMFRLVGSLLNRILFGYGERLWVLIRNYVLATFLLFPFLFYIMPGAMSLPSTSVAAVGWQPSFWTALEFSLNNAAAGALDSAIEATGWMGRVVAAVQIILSALWIGLVASYAFRWSLQR